MTLCVSNLRSCVAGRVPNDGGPARFEHAPETEQNKVNGRAEARRKPQNAEARNIGII